MAGDHTQFYSQTQKGSLSGRRLCIACKPVKDGYDGQELAVKLLKFCDKDGNELTDQMDQASGTITFSSAGMYSFTVKAVDSGNRKTTVVFEKMEHNLFLLMKQMEKNENGGYQLWNR